MVKMVSTLRFGSLRVISAVCYEILCAICPNKQFLLGSTFRKNVSAKSGSIYFLVAKTSEVKLIEFDKVARGKAYSYCDGVLLARY